MLNIANYYSNNYHAKRAREASLPKLGKMSGLIPSQLSRENCFSFQLGMALTVPPPRYLFDFVEANVSENECALLPPGLCPR